MNKWVFLWLEIYGNHWLFWNHWYWRLGKVIEFLVKKSSESMSIVLSQRFKHEEEDENQMNPLIHLHKSVEPDYKNPEELGILCPLQSLTHWDCKLFQMNPSLQVEGTKPWVICSVMWQNRHIDRVGFQMYPSWHLHVSVDPEAKDPDE